MVLYDRYVFSSILLVFSLIMPVNAISQRWGNDIMIYDGHITCFDVDYTTDGTMYLAFQKDSTDYPLCIYTSSDHGMTWDKKYDNPFLFRLSKMKIIVGEPIYNYLYFFFANPNDKNYPYLGRIASDFTGSFEPFRIDTFAVDEAGFDVVRSIENYYSMVFAGASPSRTSPEYIHWIRCYLSTDYGETWSYLSYGFSTPMDSRQELYLAWGPPSNYYLSFIATKDLVAPYDPDSSEIQIFYSTDGGATWDWTPRITNNKIRDGDPHIAASNDVNNPSIWVVSPNAPSGENNDLYVHYVPHPDSIESPSAWKSTPISTTAAAEYWGDIKFYKNPPNQYVNMAWIYDDGGDNRDVHWTQSAGSNPGNWYGDQIINDYLALPWPCGPSPRVVYSPGAPESGGGVVYAGFGSVNLYFDAPWVSGIEEKNNVKTFSISPDIVSTDGTLLLSVPRKGSIEIRIYDLVGRLIDGIGPQLMKAGSNLINLKLKGNGIYFIEVIENNRKVYRTKIIAVK
jgi:hypothetical protein